ncbi:hypothetical protein NQZ68_017508 [Dissostichus eleginoides]|nr:hypothetical protein NQZ68_017508 [Dissostichus eleginoides]
MAVMAEKKHDFTLLSKSNAYRKGVADKKEEVAALDKALKELQESDVPVMLLGFPGQGEGGSLPSEAGWSYSHED